MEVSNVIAMISLAFALLGAAAVYGTDVFFCVVGCTALTRRGQPSANPLHPSMYARVAGRRRDLGRHMSLAY